MWDKIPTDYSNIREVFEQGKPASGRLLTYRDALLEACAQALASDERVFVFGEGVDDPAGVFGTTLDLHKRFGAARVFDTPVCENALTGIAIGASLAGMRPILVHMRTDFLLMSMDQIVNHAAKWSYMFGGAVKVPLVIRAIIGGGWGSAAQHTQPFQALFAHVPGLKVVMPASAYDAKGLFISSILDDSPVIFIEHRWLYDYKDVVPQDPYLVPLGKAVIRKPGTAMTLIADSFMVALALEAAKTLEKEGIDVEVLDLRTIKPLDTGLIGESVKKTGRAAILDFGYKFCGISAEISAFLSENLFGDLKGPLLRIALPDVPTPASHVLEKAYYPAVEGIISDIRRSLKP